MMTETGICKACQAAFTYTSTRRGRPRSLCDEHRRRQTHRKAYFAAYHRNRYRSDPEYREIIKRASARYRVAHPERQKPWPERKIRRAAREEARERGVPIEKVLQEWRA